ncbi:MAG: DNA polymerase I, partial [Ruminococcus sp.]|nr:DNA polymerase I [Candidatus Apopatosoma intestinale]
MKKLLVIDGNSILNRAFYGIRPLTTRDGLFTHAVYGMVNIVEKHVTEQKPDFAAVAFDVKAPTFRHKMYADYKGTRKPAPAEFLVQLPYAKRFMDALGLHPIELAGYEADDLLGTLSAMAEKNGYEVCLVTGDKDSLQLISDKTVVMLATTGDSVRCDKAAFREKYGVRSSQFIDVKALMGDSSDNIPGVPGIGEKTALRLIADYGSLNGLYEKIEDKPITPGTKAKLIAGKESAYLSQTLATIKRDVPLSFSLDDLAYTGIDKQAVLDLCTELEFSNFIKKFGLEDMVGRKPVSDSALAESTAPELPALFFDFSEEKAYLSESGKTRALSLDEGENLLSVPEARYAVFDLKSIRHALPCEVHAFCEDIMLMGYICAAGDGEPTLSKLSSRYLLSEPESGEARAEAVGELFRILWTELEQTDQLTLYREVERPLCDVLYGMEKEGFLVDTEKLAAFGKMLEEQQREYAARIYQQAGEEFNINSPKQLGVVLFEKMGLPPVQKTKSGYSTSAEVLEKLRPYSPIIDDILDFRQVGKLKSTYADGLLKVADENGRVHTCFRQALTATGRLSSTEPNLQNIPIKTELGRELRKFFIAGGEDRVLVDADYSQIELRLLAAISGDESMISAFAGGFDIHTDTAMRIFGVSRENVTIELRKQAKAVNFGIMYGMGDFSLAGDLHISRKAAAEYIRNYLNSYPKVEEYLHKTVEQAKKDLFVKTLFGRRRAIPELASQKHTEKAFGERVAMNSP